MGVYELRVPFGAVSVLSPHGRFLIKARWLILGMAGGAVFRVRGVVLTPALRHVPWSFLFFDW